MAVVLLTGFAGLSALSSAYIAGYVLDQLQSTDALVMIVTDAGLKSVGCLGVGVAVFLRSRRQNAS